jgi:hypothetical protein
VATLTSVRRTRSFLLRTVGLIVTGAVAVQTGTVLVGQFSPAPVVVGVPNEPIAVRGSDGRVHLAYEVHVTNFDVDTGLLRLDRVDVFSDGSASPLVTYMGSDLDGRVMHPGVDQSSRYNRSIEGGQHGVVHVWITLAEDAPVPATIRHRLMFRTEKDVETSAEGARIQVHPSGSVVLGAPLKGGVWLIHNGPGNHRSPHWGSLLAVNGRVTVPQRFAIDFIGLDENGAAVRGDVHTSVNADWTGFGRDVIAVADGVVRDMRDGMPDNRPLAAVPPPAVINAPAVYGNHVVLDLDLNGHTFAHYAHLQHGSVAVKAGQHVKRGQLLGRLGNSGNTNGPHLHFSVSDSASFENSEGLPFLIDAFEVLGATTADRALGAELDAAPATFSSRQVRRELPLDGTVVRFRDALANAR